jgi:putative serine protease PepD
MAPGSRTRTYADESERAERSSPPARRLGAAIAAGVIVLVVLLAVLIAGIALLTSGGDRPTRTSAPSPSPSETAPPTTGDIFEAVGPSVVVVRTSAGALGTGTVAADDGTIITANHVVDDGSALTVIFADGTKSRADVASADAAHDIATLSPRRLPQVLVPATIGGATAVGTGVVAIGNPLGLTYSVSTGVVSGLDRTATGSNGRLSGLVQFDASVNPGSSGGPLLDDHGLVVGVVVAIADPGGDEAFAGIGFAVPIGVALGGGGPGQGPGGPQI